MTDEELLSVLREDFRRPGLDKVLEGYQQDRTRLAEAVEACRRQARRMQAADVDHEDARVKEIDALFQRELKIAEAQLTSVERTIRLLEAEKVAHAVKK